MRKLCNLYAVIHNIYWLSVVRHCECNVYPCVYTTAGYVNDIIIYTPKICK